MQQPNEIVLPEAQPPGAWGRLTRWARQNRPLVWLVVIAIGLALFLVWMPPFVRLLFWTGLQANALLAGMVLGFGLLALSLLWSAGQQLDSWTFIFFNVRGHRPRWLDLVMTGVTQIGNGIAAGVLAAICFVAGYRLLAYELILGVLTLWLVVELVKVLAHRRRPFRSHHPGAHRRPARRRAFLSQRAHRPGLFHGDAAGRLLCDWDLGRSPALRHRAAGGRHAHVRGRALPARRAGRGHPGHSLGAAGRDRLWIYVAGHALSSVLPGCEQQQQATNRTNFVQNLPCAVQPVEIERG